MNYKLYKIHKLLTKIMDKIMSTIFYLPRKLYKTNKKFKKYIDNSNSNKHKKRRIKQLSMNIFYDIEKQGECIVLVGTDYDNDFYFDRQDSEYKLFLSDEVWINKNHLNIKRMTVKDYVLECDKERLYLVSEYFGKQIVCIITKK